jgi:hypothetical protein
VCFYEKIDSKNGENDKIWKYNIPNPFGTEGPISLLITKIKRVNAKFSIFKMLNLTLTRRLFLTNNKTH